jgi:hypothetical protein
MRHGIMTACGALLLAAGSAFAAAGGQPGDDGNATTPSAAPRTEGKADSQRDAEEAFTQGKAECRRVAKDARRDCVRRVERDYDKTQRVVKPPRKPVPETVLKP